MQCIFVALGLLMLTSVSTIAHADGRAARSRGGERVESRRSSASSDHTNPSARSSYGEGDRGDRSNSGGPDCYQVPELSSDRLPAALVFVFGGGVILRARNAHRQAARLCRS
jgi:hypothetical protein